MGSFMVTIQVGNTLGGDLHEVEALVDTGANSYCVAEGVSRCDEY